MMMFMMGVTLAQEQSALGQAAPVTSSFEAAENFDLMSAAANGCNG
jgi:hypothetical protein